MNGRARLIAGGTDLLLSLKGDILPNYPEAIINIKTIPDLALIEEDNGFLKIGALARLSDVAKSPVIRSRCSVLAKAAFSVASPQIRNAATIGGNLCQDTRCWYYRYPRQIGGPLQCARKGKGHCLAIKGDNRYHAVFGGKKCFAVCPSDIAVALAALDAGITISDCDGERDIGVTEFYHPLGNDLHAGEMLTFINIPKDTSKARHQFLKFTLRKPIDFAVVSVVTIFAEEDGVCTQARIALGALATGPVRAYRAEEMLIGRKVRESLFEKASEVAMEDAKPLSMNAYKIEIAKGLIKKALLSSKMASNRE